jgi:hypothetical protein
MQNKIKSLTNIIQHLINENTQLRDLSVGSLEIIKLLPGYDDALETLKLMPGYDKAIEDLQKSLTKKEEDGVIEQDTK